MLLSLKGLTLNGLPHAQAGQFQKMLIKKYTVDVHVRADCVGTQEGMYPAQLFSHLREFGFGNFFSYYLGALNTLC